MSATQRRQRVRAILGGSTCVVPISVFDAMSARIGEDLGFEVGMLAGSTASMVVLGAPDVVLLTLSEFAEQARRICRAAGLPLMVDADHGYGNALNVRRTVEELETAGVAALTIEDTSLPQGYGGTTRLIRVEEGVGKLSAALGARVDPTLVVCGRTSAIATDGLAEALARIQAYQALGIDAMFLTGVTSWEQLDAVAKVAAVPLILGNVPAGLAKVDELAARGVRICLQGHQPILAAIQAVYATMSRLRQGVAPEQLADLAATDLLRKVTRADDVERWERAFLGRS